MDILFATLLLMIDEIALMTDRLAACELRVIWAVVKGSALNKAILAPALLLISTFLNWALVPLLMLGGLYLCHQGAEKILPRRLGAGRTDSSAEVQQETIPSATAIDDAAAERAMIREALLIDFVLSAEILVVALFALADQTLAVRAASLAGVAAFATVGIYGAVFGFLRLDDAGRYLSRRDGQWALGRWQRRLGRALLALSPYLLRTFAVVGTAAALLIGGEILVFGVPGAEDGIDGLIERFAAIPVVGDLLGWAIGPLLEIAIGIVAGVITVVATIAAGRLLSRWPFSVRAMQ